MKTTIAAAGLALLTVSGAFIGAEPRDTRDASRARIDALADLRAALGGDAALNRVSTITMKGKVKRPGAMAFSGGTEVWCALPDKFLRVTRVAHAPQSERSRPVGYIDLGNPAERSSFPPVDYVNDDRSSVERRGFNGREPIANGGRTGGSPSNLAVSLGISRAQRAFAAFVVPLMAQGYSGYPMTGVAEGKSVTFRADDAMTFRLDLDPVTHRPATLTWSDYPPMRPRGAGSSSVQDWVMTFSDYRAVSGGLMWPHRISTSAGGSMYEEVTITSYEVNKPIKASTFKTR